MLILYDKNLVMIRPIDNIVKWGYHEKLNELTTGSMTLPAGDPITARIDVPGSFVRAYDGARDLGYFCVSAIQDDKHAPRGTITYQLQGAEATLVRRLMDGWHEIGGTDYPTRRVIEYILGLQRVRRWVLGECAYTDYYQYNFNDTTLLESLLSLGEVLLEDHIFVFDSTATPWTMHLRRAPQEATRSLVYRRGMTGLTRSVDGRIITRLYGRGYGEGDNQLTIASVNGGVPYLTADAATIARYDDEWDGVHVDTRQTDPATLKAHMARILEAGKRPTASYEATAIDLYRLTGEPWDDIRIGDKVIILDELLGEPVTVRCTGRKKDDVEGDPGAIALTLDNSRADTAEELSEIRDKIGVHELYSQGATNMYSMQLSDNADASHPLTMRFYVPGNVLRINSCLIYWQTERFRTYATLAKSGGGSTRTSQIGGGATVSLPVQIVTTSASTGAPQGGEGTSALYTEQNTEGLATREVDNHRHSVENHAHNLNAHTHASFTSGPSPAVTVANGPGSTGYAGKHAHDIDAYTHKHDHWHKVTVTITIPAMTFELESHSHTVTIPEHTHELEYGVYEGARSASISISVDGEAVPSEAITDARELDVAKYLRKDDDGRVTRGTWHEIEFTPDGITRITADLFFQVFIQSRGAGDY